MEQPLIDFKDYLTNHIIFLISLFLRKHVLILMLSSEQTLNQKKSTRKNKKNDKVNTKKEKQDKEVIKEKTQKIKLPKPIIYDPNQNHINIRLVEDKDDNNSYKQSHERIIKDAEEITNYYLELHKNMVNTYNLIYSQIIQNNSGLSWSVFFSNSERLTNYPSDIKSIYSELISNRDESLKLIDNIITKNIDTFIKSLELTQKFYKDILQSYCNCINKFK